MKITHVILYKLKNRRNIEDIVEICRNLNIEVIYIARDYVEHVPENMKVFRSIEECLREIENVDQYIILETYGNKYLPEIDFKNNICIVVGAEDLGIPEKEIEKFPRERTCIVKIPMGRYGSSYNVVTSLIMMLTEFLIRKMMKVS
ncbi:MAG: tRNA (cytidine(34)-2'-O)-methyltransferase [Crenarchaeota archaeon]|nr:tRNA (cytidine(34)-2'-O)-methyltransferase [Thermoproteota archaeon]